MTRRHWNGTEIQLLRERYPHEGPAQLSLELGRSQDSISSFARRCGLRTQRRPYQHRKYLASLRRAKNADR